MLYLYADRRLSRLGSVPGKVLNLIPLSSKDDSIAVLITMHDCPDIRILTVSLGARDISSDMSLRAVDERFVLTSAAQFYGHLIIGSRNGFMEVFTAQDGAYTRIAEISPRSGGAITSIVPLPGQTGLSPISFLTTNRDGMYRIYELDMTDGQSPRARLLHETPPPFGPQIEDAWFCEEEGGGPAYLILTGFRSKDFIAWNETKREYIAVVDCGGAHRTFAHSKSARPDRIHFAFTKATKVYIHSQERPASRTLKPGSHGREVRAIASGAGYFATGSEDTTIRIWERLEDAEVSLGAPFRCVTSMNAHTTGLQCLRWCGERLLSSGGNEDLFIWRVSRLPAGLAVSCEAIFRDKSPVGDLRITDMDVCADEEEDSGALRVTMAFSNSVFKTYRYEPPAPGGEGKFEVLARGEYTGACFTQVRSLGRREGAALPDVLTASTDGYIALWTPVGESYATTSVARIHQSSIKALDLRTVGEGAGYVVTTGGDDNALAVTWLTPDSEGMGALTVSGRTIVRSAHAAAINGVVGLTGGNRVVSVSNDQRVKVWEVSGDVSGGKPPTVRLVEDMYSGVSDACAVEYLGCTGEVVVGGVGTEIWRVDT
ncbi:uncharacterized protein DNG_04986 [Cephalotrichum gorgonifer]|uniref:WD40 domain-containing protein n=1 Tax=Cephalotrichum gorgonifer TaxID=2041049 RepID=A0AAE8MYP8_9PEZI|nr:uncharacterized protein DNG_04986 [Cephalotrichum gorgonifer]